MDRPAGARHLRSLTAAVAALVALVAVAAPAGAEPAAAEPASGQPAAADGAAGPAPSGPAPDPAADRAAAADPAPSVSCARLARQVAYHLRGEEWLDAHILAQLAAGLCPGLEGQRAALHGAVALVRLEEHERAVGTLAALRAGADPALRARAAVLESWALLAADPAAFRRSLGRLPPPARRRLEVLAAIGGEDGDGDGDGDRVRRLAAGLDGELRRVVEARYGAYEDRRGKRPWLAGGLSAVLPGAGQVYAGSWEAGAVALVLNGVLIAATVELAREELYFAAGTTGLAASVFYVGGILNAADLARRHNERASAGERRALDRALVPEAFP